MKVLLFKVSTCERCRLQENIFKSINLEYVPCELFKNRELARKYKVSDVPTTIIVDSENNLIRKYDYSIMIQQAKKIKSEFF